jgi:Mg2+/Co2+ transporter CorB
MMAINRFRLKYLVSEGNSSAIRVAEMLKRTDRLLGGILIGNTLAITVATTIAGLITVRLFGDDKVAYFVSPIVVGFLLIVFAEITPKVIGATHPERTALLLSFPLKVTLRTLDLPAWFVNLFVRPLLWLLRIRPGEERELQKLSPEEIRTLVLESSVFMPKKHVSILMNLFDLGDITVQDIMLPRAGIESITLEEPIESIVRQLATSTHRRLPVYRDREGDVIGILHLRRILDPLRAGYAHQGCDRGAARRAVLRARIDGGLRTAAILPGSARERRARGRRIRRGDGARDARGHPRGDRRQVHAGAALGGALALLGRERHGARRWVDADSRGQPGARAEPADRRAEDAERPHPGAPAGHPEADVSVRIAGVVIEITHAQGRSIKTVRLFKPAETPVEEVA